MIISDKGIELIKRFEGCRLSAYRCPAGVWTIGYGHTLNVKPGDKITQDQADEYLREDLKKFENLVSSYKYEWTQPEFDALVSFAFNVGNIAGLTAAGTRSKAQIADAMLLYVRAKGVTLPGLITRRQAEHDFFVSAGSPKKSNDEIALEVIKGLWKNGRERTKLLKDAGYDPKEIQKIVNKLLKS